MLCLLVCILFILARNYTDFRSNSWLQNQLITAHILDLKIIWFQLIFFDRKPADFSSYYCWKFSWFQLILLARKSAEFSSYSWIENQLILIFLDKKSVDFSQENNHKLDDFLANNMSWNQLIFMRRIQAEINWISYQEYELKSAYFLANKTTIT